MFIQTPLLTHSTNTVQAAVVEASLCSSGNDFFFQLRAFLFSKGKKRLNVDLHTVRQTLSFWMHEVVLRIRAAEAEKWLTTVVAQKMVCSSFCLQTRMSL